MGNNKVPWKTGMAIYLPVTSRPLISLQKEAVSQVRQDDNKNKICALRGGGAIVGREENRPKTLFFVGNATTIKF